MSALRALPDIRMVRPVLRLGVAFCPDMSDSHRWTGVRNRYGVHRTGYGDRTQPAPVRARARRARRARRADQPSRTPDNSDRVYPHTTCRLGIRDSWYIVCNMHVRWYSPPNLFVWRTVADARGWVCPWRPVACRTAGRIEQTFDRSVPDR